ncbi:MAG: 3'-5' exonuclease [Anaerolineae bacterium]|nr:3'-5' exonuclease [Anaerolineae bacterium]
MSKQNSAACNETFVSVDVETSGPNPSQYSLLSIGACLVHDRTKTFYVELRPVNHNATEEALMISRLSLEHLDEQGVPPAEAMAHFEAWLTEVAPPNAQPIFVAFNAPFDWMFVNDYFHRFLGQNPFGYSALDVKSFYMGVAGVCWSETSLRYATARYLEQRPLTHHALQDALDQAELFEKMLDS